MRKAVFACILIALIVVICLLLANPSSAPKAEKLDEQNYVARAEKRDIAFSVEVTGDITPAFQLEVKPEVGGKIKKLYVAAGQEVGIGDPLVDIDDTDLLTEKAGAQTEIEGAQLSVDKFQRNFDRARELFESKLISREVFDNLASDLSISGNNLAKSQRRLQIVEDRLRKTRIFAPMSGTVLSLPVITGQVVVAAASVNSGTTLLTIADLSRLLVDTHVNQVDIAKLELDQRVQLSGEAIRDNPVEASVEFIAPVASIKNNVKGFQVKALIEKVDPRLRPGMTIVMSVPIANVEQAISVPISAVFKDGDTDRVVYVRRGETTEKRKVTVGVSDLEYAEIKSGLREGEEILLVEPGKLRKQS